MKVIIDITSIFQAAMAYVMLSRVCAIWQIFILNKLDDTKIYPSRTALKELKRLNDKAMKKEVQKSDNEGKVKINISSLNCRSLRKHYEDIIQDIQIMNNDMICLQETWLQFDDIEEDLKISNFALHLNSY